MTMDSRLLCPLSYLGVVYPVYRCTRRERKALLFTRPRQARPPPTGSNSTPVQESASMRRGPILGIEVSDATLARWTGWFAPDPQPFLVAGGEHVPVSEELRDTFGLYDLTRRRVSVRWIREVEYFAMTRSERSALLRDQVRLGRALVPTVASIGPNPTSVWRAAETQLPAARRVAGDHAAVTLGSGWALHKPSQGWMSPSTVLRTAALIRSVRMNGLRMQRYLLHDPV